jgi:hypothetical protein
MPDRAIFSNKYWQVIIIFIFFYPPNRGQVAHSNLLNYDNLTTKWFLTGATFEMRAVLYEIHLFNDKVEMHNGFFISNK